MSGNGRCLRQKKWVRALAAPALAWLFAGCGYSAHRLAMPEAKTISVPIFDNLTFRRGHEFALTEAVVKQIQARTPYRVVERDEADLVLDGVIEDYRLPAVISGRSDVLIQSTVSIRLRISVTDRRTGKIVRTASGTEHADLVGQRGEGEGTASVEVYEKLARWVVTRLEPSW